MPAAIPILIAVTAATAVAGAVEQNQQIQHAKGAAQAQKTAMDAQIKTATDADAATQKQKADVGGSTQAAAIAALRASMTSGTGMGNTILTSPTGTGGAAPTVGKTLLGA